MPALKALVEAGHQVIAVVTQPDKPKGQGKGSPDDTCENTGHGIRHSGVPAGEGAGSILCGGP